MVKKKSKRGPRQHKRSAHQLRREVSAGGVLCRRVGDAGLEFCIVNTHGGRDWQFPKGHQEEGETLEQTALREVREESGMQGRILAPLSLIRYQFRRPGRTIDKAVYFYVMEYVDGNPADHDDEVTAVRWVAEAEIMRILTYPNERELAIAAALHLRKQPPI